MQELEIAEGKLQQVLESIRTTDGCDLLSYLLQMALLEVRRCRDKLNAGVTPTSER
jgi:hypothetical protein